MTTLRAQQAATAETGSQFYVRYLAAVKAATTMEHVLAFWSQKAVQMYQSAPANQKMGFADIQGAYASFGDINVVKETGTPTAATLTLGASFNGKKMTGTVYLVKEDGSWKLFGPENWVPATD